MVHLKFWKDENGYGVEVDSIMHFGISHDDMGLLIEELKALEEEVLGEEDESIQREILLGIED